MDTITSTFTRAEFGRLLKGKNPDSPLDENALVEQAAQDHSDSISLDGDTVTARHPAQLPTATVAQMIQVKNPHLSGLPASDVIAATVKDAPGAFTRNRAGMVTITATQGDSVGAAAQEAVKQGQQQGVPPITQPPQTDSLLKRSTPAPRPGVVPIHTPPASLLKRSTPMPQPQPGVAPAHQRKPQPQVAPLPTHQPVTNPWPGVLEGLSRTGNAALRGGASWAGGMWDTTANVLEPATWIDKGWRGLMSLVGVESGEGPAERLQQASRNQATDIGGQVQADTKREIEQYGSIPAFEQMVEGGSQMALDLATKYRLAGSLIKMAGGTPTPDKIMALVSGVDNADKGVVATALGMGEGYVRGKFARATENYGKGVNVAVQGGGAAVEELARSGDVREAGKQFVLQGGMAAKDAKGGRRLRDDLRSRPVPSSEPVVNVVTGQAAQPVAAGERGSVGVGGPENSYTYIRHSDGNFTFRDKDGRDVAHASPAELPGLVGETAAKQMLSQSRSRADVGRTIQGVINLPKALVTSGDVSAPARQGITLAIPHPVLAAKAFGAQMKALVSERYARQVHNDLTTGQGAQRRKDAGLYLSDYENAKLGRREEVYASQFAEGLPVVRQSNRAYSTFLNKLRSDVFDKIADGNPTLTPKDLQGVAKFINYATGRGDLGRFNDSAILNNLFFSPKYLASRFQTLAAPATLETAAARKIAAKEITKFIGGGMALMIAAKAGGLDVEIDPRSTLFGRISIGNHHYDLWGGYTNVARHFAQIVTGQKKASDGEIYDISRVGNALDFAREKLAPVPSAAVDLKAGQNLRGEAVTPASAALGLIEPYAWKDIRESIQDDLNQGGSGVKGAVMGAPSLLGVGTSTYETKPEPDPVTKELHRLYRSVNPRGGPRPRTGPRLLTVGDQTVKGEIVPAAINSDTYKTLPDDKAKLDFVNYVQNYAEKVRRVTNLPSEAVKHNSLVLIEQLKWQAQVDASDLSLREKARKRDAVNKYFNAAQVYENERRRMTSIERVFGERKAGAPAWFQSLMSKGQ